MVRLLGESVRVGWCRGKLSKRGTRKGRKRRIIRVVLTHAYAENTRKNKNKNKNFPPKEKKRKKKKAASTPLSSS